MNNNDHMNMNNNEESSDSERGWGEEEEERGGEGGEQTEVNYEELVFSEDSLSENSYCFSEQQLVKLGIDSDFFSKIPQDMKQDVIESAFLLQQNTLLQQRQEEEQKQEEHFRKVKEQVLSIQETYLL